MAAPSLKNASWTFKGEIKKVTVEIKNRKPGDSAPSCLEEALNDLAEQPGTCQCRMLNRIGSLPA